MDHRFYQILDTFRARLVAGATSVGERVILEKLGSLAVTDAPGFMVDIAEISDPIVDGDGYGDRQESYRLTVAVFALAIAQPNALRTVWNLAAEAKAALSDIAAYIQVDDCRTAGYGTTDEVKTDRGKLLFVPLLFHVTVSLDESDHTLKI